jgi:hypothetical protein
MIKKRVLHNPEWPFWPLLMLESLLFQPSPNGIQLTLVGSSRSRIDPTKITFREVANEEFDDNNSHASQSRIPMEVFPVACNF